MPSATRSSMTGPAGRGGEPPMRPSYTFARFPRSNRRGRWSKAASGPTARASSRRPRSARRPERAGGGPRPYPARPAPSEHSRTPGHRPRQPRPPEAEGPWPEREPCTVFSYPARFPLGKFLAHRRTAIPCRLRYHRVAMPASPRLAVNQRLTRCLLTVEQRSAAARRRPLFIAGRASRGPAASGPIAHRRRGFGRGNAVPAEREGP